MLCRFDCEDHSDEKGCEFKRCKPEEFQCKKGGTCIQARYRCDYDKVRHVDAMGTSWYMVTSLGDVHPGSIQMRLRHVDAMVTSWYIIGCHGDVTT